MSDPDRAPPSDEGETLVRRVVSIAPPGQSTVSEEGATIAIPSGDRLLDGTLANSPEEIASRPTAKGSADTSSSMFVSQAQLAGRYELLGFVGAGGMGRVYRARDIELDEIVALKVLSQEIVGEPGMLERFRREVKLARRVTHRNVARVFDIGEHQGEKFLTMELIEGEALTQLIAREHPIAIPRAITLAEGICAGLSAAHAASVVHRDLKPDNVLIAKDGRAVVTDFGIARAVSSSGGAGQTMGMLLGTPAYMAPEQVEGRDDIDARADIYALGALLFELFTGQRAWPGDSPFAVASARLVSPPPNPRKARPNLPERCAELVLRCMARQREQRFDSTEQVAAELVALRDALSASSAMATMAAPSISPVPRAPTSTGISSPTGVGPSEKTIAVLPFRNAGASEDDYLAEELTDDLTDSLSMTRGLRVRSRGMVQRFKGSDQDLREVGSELGVQAVIEGSVRRARGMVRVSARVICVADGFQIWAKRFDKPEQDVLSINDEAAQAIAEALTVQSKAPAREAPKSPMAVDLYLRGRHEYRKFWADHQRRALEYFSQAEAFSPGDPVILAAKAMAMARLAFFSGEGAEAAKAAAEQAVAASPDLAEAQLALGSSLFQLGDWSGAARALKQAVLRGPGLAEAHAALGRLLVEIGEVDEGIRRLESARSLDPQVPLARSTLARAYALLGKWQLAEEEINAIKAAEGESVYWTNWARLMLWKRDEAQIAVFIESMQKQPIDVGNASRMIIELMAHRRLPTGYQEMAREVDRLDIGLRRRSFIAQMQTEAAMFMEDHEHALTMLQKSVDAGLIDLSWVDRCPLLEPLRTDPRFHAARGMVVARVNEILNAYRGA